jgi:hypothetical protein
MCVLKVEHILQFIDLALEPAQRASDDISH